MESPWLYVFMETYGMFLFTFFAFLIPTEYSRQEYFDRGEINILKAI